MALILNKLMKCCLDPEVLMQRELTKMPNDDTAFIIQPSRSYYLHCVKDRRPTGDRIYALQSDLANDISSEVIKHYAITPVRAENGLASLMITNLSSSDDYSRSKRWLLKQGDGLFQVKRLTTEYKFTESKDSAPIEPVSDHELTELLELMFSNSIIDNNQHVVFNKNRKQPIEPAQRENKTCQTTPVISNVQSTGIDISNIDFIDL